MKKYSISLLIREMQIKTTLRYHLTPNMRGKENDKYWRRCGNTGTPMHFWWSCEWIQPFWRAIWNYVQRARKMCIPFDSAISLLALYPKETIKMGKGLTSAKIFI